MSSEVPTSSDHQVETEDTADGQWTGSRTTRKAPPTKTSEEERYKMNHTKRGKFVIINNVNFKSKSSLFRESKEDIRKGSDVDAENLEALFRGLGFDIVRHTDMTNDQMLQAMLDVVKEHKQCNQQPCKDPSNCPIHWDCFGCAILTHGADSGKLTGVDFKNIKVDNLIAPIRDCGALAGKPKLFFIQACRGADEDEGVLAVEKEDSGSGDVEDMTKLVRIPVEADFLYAFATAPGYVAWRNAVKGSWYIQELVKVFNECVADTEICTLLTKVNRLVSRRLTVSEDKTKKPSGLQLLCGTTPAASQCNYKKQIPSFTSLLTKELYFK